MTTEHNANIRKFIKECKDKNSTDAEAILGLILESKVKDRVNKTIKTNTSENN